MVPFYVFTGFIICTLGNSCVEPYICDLVRCEPQGVWFTLTFPYRLHVYLGSNRFLRAQNFKNIFYGEGGGGGGSEK